MCSQGSLQQFPGVFLSSSVSEISEVWQRVAIRFWITTLHIIPLHFLHLLISLKTLLRCLNQGPGMVESPFHTIVGLNHFSNIYNSGSHTVGSDHKWVVIWFLVGYRADAILKPQNLCIALVCDLLWWLHCVVLPWDFAFWGATWKGQGNLRTSMTPATDNEGHGSKTFENNWPRKFLTK